MTIADLRSSLAGGGATCAALRGVLGLHCLSLRGWSASSSAVAFPGGGRFRGDDRRRLQRTAFRFGGGRWQR